MICPLCKIIWKHIFTDLQKIYIFGTTSINIIQACEIGVGKIFFVAIDTTVFVAEQKFVEKPRMIIKVYARKQGSPTVYLQNQRKYILDLRTRIHTSLQSERNRETFI